MKSRNNMYQEKLDEMYDSADNSKLLKMFDIARNYEIESRALSQKAGSILENVSNAIKRRFEKVDKTPENLGGEQVKEMSKQWSIMSASMVRVKRAVQLDGFYSKIDQNHIGLNLYVSTKYGIKEHKRYQRYSPLFIYNIDRYAKNDKAPYKMEGNRLYIREESWNSGCLDFNALHYIPQLDKDKINLLIELTRDGVNMVNSWIGFYKKIDAGKIKEVNEFSGMSRYNMTNDADMYRDKLKHIDDWVKFKQSLCDDMKAQAARWEPVITKWKEANRNFMVLNELSPEKINI